ncbi:squamous cell carcinoma antigen recognized by T-cells 3 [Echria macrotheca]|uniref:U4/U6 snRNA-associated-splicing factor PRP24 n=1 Tax=Echria macrotheca TaxID=438768 RepID=A0AAJ0B8X7_9PEZI|nr:squamous cell carcinoma antigen recognized by T-cells 3 [Echria macrotheca]
MASPVGEDNWVGFVDNQLRGATDLDTRVNVVECFRRAVSAEPGSLKVWLAYCEYFWSLYTDCQPGSDAGWSPEEQQLGREAFTLDAALNLWQEGYEAVQYRLADSHELWNRWVSLEMELLARTATPAGIRRITHLFKMRLATPHATWDATSQMFSTFLSEYNRQAYETEMAAVTRDAHDAKRLYNLRDPFEMKLDMALRSGDAGSAKQVMAEYLGWEIKQSRGKKDALTNFQICLGLFSRALTGIMASDEDAWMNFLVFISTAHSELKAGHSRIPASHLPNMLDVLQRAVHHLPWCGPVWSRYILAAEEAGLSFTDIERIKHAATSSSQLDRDGMSGVIDMYAAWCGYLKRTAMNPNATEEAVDLAEVGLPSALEDVRHWGKRRYGDAYQGDPNFRLEKIFIQFLTEKKDNIEAARAVWEQLSEVSLYANSYDFWLHWFLWEMVVFTATKNKTRSPTPVTVAQGLRVPSFATRVFTRALKVHTLDWPERIMEVYLQHCNDYELAETLREAQDTIYKTRKGVLKRREREAAQAAAAQAQYAPETQEHTMVDAPQPTTESAQSPGSKRKRGGSTNGEDDTSSKRARSEAPNGVDAKRDRENTSVFIGNLPGDVTLTKVKQFFREYGHINNIEMQRKDDGTSVALVEFRTADEARSALLRDGKFVADRAVSVTSATDCTLYVTNYPPEADTQYIRELFKDCGEIHSIRFPSLKFNTARRFCYLTFCDREAAAAAIKLDGKTLEGGKFKLLAKISDPGMKQHRHGAQAEGREIHVTNLPRNVDEDEIRVMFEKAGRVVSVRLLRDMAGKSKGAGFVVMETKEQTEEAIKTLDTVIWGNRALKVELSLPASQKTTATTRGPLGAGSPEGGSPAPSGSGFPSSAPGSTGATPADIAARTIAVLGIPDTMTDARVRAMLAPIGTIVKLVLHPKHGGAVVEFADAATVGKAALAIEGLEIEDGKKLRTGTVSELFKQQGEIRVDRIDQAPSKTASKPTPAQLMPPPPTVRRVPVLGRGGKRGLGFVGAAKKEPNGTSSANGGTAPGGGKSNADFKKMFLGGK